MSIVTRFAPSPSGLLHIGGARTALFNWLYARKVDGKFLLRIEDTDRERTSKQAISAILNGLEWLGLNFDDKPLYQFARRKRHVEVVNTLLESGKAYKCYCSQEELSAMREKARAEKRSIRYDGTWRERDPSDAPKDVKPVIRFKSPETGTTTVLDMVQGKVEIPNTELDDLVMLRADGTPTYMLSVVVDDHDMGITHIIRGDDHLTNALRQSQIFMALNWRAPLYAHIPLIHGSDGVKLSKRHGATGVGDFRDLGYLPEAINNYLCRLGWSHGNEEFFSMNQAIEWFEIANINKGASRFDLKKLTNLNSKYINESQTRRLIQLAKPRLEVLTGRSLGDIEIKRLEKGMNSLKSRVETIQQLADLSLFYCAERPITLSEKGKKILNAEALSNISQLIKFLSALDNWSEEEIEKSLKVFVNKKQIKLGHIAQPIRVALTGTNVSPGIFEVAAILGKTEVLDRLTDVITQYH